MLLYSKEGKSLYELEF